MLGDRKTKFRTLSLQTLAFAALFLCVPLLNTAKAQDITTGLVGHWNFDETTGPLADSSGNGNDAALSGGGTYSSISGKINGAGYFDGNIKADVPYNTDTTGLTNVTYSVWLKPQLNEREDFSGCLNGETASGAPLFQIDNNGTEAGKIKFFSWMRIGGVSNTRTVTIDPYPLDTWVHFVYTYDGSAEKIYVNGSEVGSWANTGALHTNTECGLRIGHGYLSQYTGGIDDVRLYNRALTDADIIELYNNASKLPPCNTDADSDGEPDYEAVMLYNNDEKVMQYCNGTEWISVGSSISNIPTNCDNIGDTCSDGTIYAGLSPDGSIPMYTPPADQSSAAYWGTDNFTTGANSTVSGSTNSADVYAHVLAGDGDANPDNGFTPNAFVLCEELDAYGHDDWYLPAQDELGKLYDGLVDQDGDSTPGGPLGSTFGFDTSGTYWSSYETSMVRSKDFNNGTNYGEPKDSTNAVRCVRKSNAVASTACTSPEAEPGTMFYNRAEGVLQYCNGESWINMGPKTATGGVDVDDALSPAAPAGSLIGYWPLDADATDSAGSNDGSLVGGSSIVTGGKFAGALDLDGTNGQVDFGDPAGGDLDFGTANSFTLSAWIKPDVVSGLSRIFSKGHWAWNNGGYAVWLYDGQIEAGLTGVDQSSSVAVLTSSAVIDANIWSHVVITFDQTAKTISIIVNGEAQSLTKFGGTCGTVSSTELDYSACTQVTASSAHDFRLGSHHNNGEYYDGLIDDVRIYGSALSEEEVAALYKSNSLAGHWKLDETEGTDAADSSGNGNTGTLNGTDFDESAATGRSGGALTFDGTDDYIDFSEQFIRNEGTISHWVKADMISDTMIAYYEADGATSIYNGFGHPNDILEINTALSGDGSFKFYYQDGTEASNKFEVSSTTILEQDIWYLVTVTWNKSDNAKLYINGQLENSVNISGISFANNVASLAQIGKPGIDTRYWDGQIDDVRIYNRALSADEIGEMYMATGGDKVDADCTGLGDAHYNDPSTGHCYYRVDTPANFTTALANCQADGAYLAEITSDEENDTIFNNLGGPGGDLIAAFFGASDQAVEGQWRWVSGGPKNGELFFTGDQNTGSAVDGMYANRFGQGLEPNNGAAENCGAFSNIISSGWNDDLCGDPEVYVCEKSADIGGTCSNPYAEIGVMFYNNDEDIMQFCNGEEWVGITGTVPGTIPVPDTTDPVWTTAAGTVDTIEPSTALSVTVTATDDSGTVTYSKTGGAGWISVNATTGELTGTAPGSATTDSITVTATDPSGNTTARSFDVVVASDPCAGSPTPGTTCADGTIYAGDSPDGGVPMYTTPSDQSSAAFWGAYNFATGSTSDTTGRANSADVYAHVQAGDGDSNPDDGDTPNAFVLCEELDIFGHDDWYVPARRELNVLYANKNAGDLSGTFNEATGSFNGYYWSSTEDLSFGNPTLYAQARKFNNGTWQNWTKSLSRNLRCVRR